MASRQEEKERRREQRRAAEAEAAAQAERMRRMRVGLAAAGGLAVAAAIIVALVAGGGSAGGGPRSAAGIAAVPVPARRIADMAGAVRASGCALRNYPFATQPRFRGHTTATVRYTTNPPAFGPHDPTPASDGDYAGRATPPVGQLVHSLEHGRVQFQYRPGTSRREIGQLVSLLGEPDGPYGPGQYAQLFENSTGMPAAVAATAWGHVLTCPALRPEVFDALRAFRAAYTLQAPEYIPQPE